jgi:two-component system, response regulator PdtaR
MNMHCRRLTAPSSLWFSATPPKRDERNENRSEEASATKQPLRILIVEDEFFIALDVQALVEAMGHSVVGIAVSAEQAVIKAQSEKPDLVLMDIRLNGARDGISAASEIRERYGIYSIFVTANTDSVTRQRAEAVKPIAFLEKPLTEARLKQALAQLTIN